MAATIEQTTTTRNGTVVTRRYHQPGEVVWMELPWSEVCIHMRIAGQRFHVRLTDGPYPMAEILRPGKSSHYCPSVLPGEAGFYHDERGFYTVQVGA